MEEILRAVRRARRTLVFLDALRILPWAALALAMPVAALSVLHRLGTSVPYRFAPLAAAPAAALVAAVVRRPSMRTSAIALDRAAGLRERLSAALFVQSEEAAAAVRADAVRALRASDAGIPMRLPRPWALGGAAALCLAALVVPLPVSNATPPTPDRSPVLPEPVRREQSEKLRRRAFELEKRPELRELAAEMRKLSEELRKNEISRNEALAKISKLEERAAEKRSALEKLGEQLKSGESIRLEEGDLNALLERLAQELAALEEDKERLRSDEST